jgi:hypothetical protein
MHRESGVIEVRDLLQGQGRTLNPAEYISLKIRLTVVNPLHREIVSA